MKRPDPIDQLIAEQKQLIAELQQCNIELKKQLEHAQQRIAELEARVGKNSTNSSKPPSLDPPNAPSKKPPRKRRSGRKRGGQPGHPRHERALVPIERVTSVTVAKPSQCRQCGHCLSGDDPPPYRHQLWEVPRVEPTVTEYQLHRLYPMEHGRAERAGPPPRDDDVLSWSADRFARPSVKPNCIDTSS